MVLLLLTGKRTKTRKHTKTHSKSVTNNDSASAGGLKPVQYPSQWPSWPTSKKLRMWSTAHPERNDRRGEGGKWRRLNRCDGGEEDKEEEMLHKSKEQEEEEERPT